MIRPPFPPFTADTAALKVRLAEDAWNTRAPTIVVQDCTLDSHWRTRAEFLRGRNAIAIFLTRKWQDEVDIA